MIALSAPHVRLIWAPFRPSGSQEFRRCADSPATNPALLPLTDEIEPIVIRFRPAPEQQLVTPPPRLLLIEEIGAKRLVQHPLAL